MGLAKHEEYYTYQDYASWPDDVRYELVDGVPYAMAPATFRHQGVAGEIFAAFREYLKGKPCKTRMAPLAVRLNADGADDIVVEPDVLILCDQSKVVKGTIVGAPDLVVEVLSPSTRSRDLRMKRVLYEEYGVREYWIADPENNTVTVYVSVNGGFGKEGVFVDEVRSRIFPGLVVELAEVFA